MELVIALLMWFSPVQDNAVDHNATPVQTVDEAAPRFVIVPDPDEI